MGKVCSGARRSVSKSERFFSSFSFTFVSFDGSGGRLREDDGEEEEDKLEGVEGGVRLTSALRSFRSVLSLSRLAFVS